MTEQDTITEPENTNEGEVQAEVQPEAKLSDDPVTPTLSDSESVEVPQTEDAGETTDTEVAEQDGAPETYADFELPEGIEAGDRMLDDFRVAAKEANMTQEQAQGMFSKMVEAKGADDTSRLAALTDQWGKESQADGEYGGDKFAENLATAKTAYTKFASPELQNLLKASGLEGHPEVIRLFFRTGSALRDDRFVGEGSGDATPDFSQGSVFDHKAEAAARLFPSTAKRG